MAEIRCAYDAQVDAVSMRFGAGQQSFSHNEFLHSSTDPDGGVTSAEPLIITDMNTDGKIIGFEILNASAHFAPEFLASMEQL